MYSWLKYCALSPVSSSDEHVGGIQERGRQGRVLARRLVRLVRSDHTVRREVPDSQHTACSSKSEACEEWRESDGFLGRTFAEWQFLLSRSRCQSSHVHKDHPRYHSNLGSVLCMGKVRVLQRGHSQPWRRGELLSDSA